MKNQTHWLAVVCCLWLQTSVAAPPPTRPNLVRRGRQVAELVCGACHLVIKDQEFPPFLKVHTPSFYEIATQPGINPGTLRRFITTTHWDEKSIPMTMPNQELTPEELSAVVAYILSLRPNAAVP